MGAGEMRMSISIVQNTCLASFLWVSVEEDLILSCGLLRESTTGEVMAGAPRPLGAPGPTKLSPPAPSF